MFIQRRVKNWRRTVFQMETSNTSSFHRKVPIRELVSRVRDAIMELFRQNNHKTHHRTTTEIQEEHLIRM